MRERRKNFRVEWNSAGKIYDRNGRFARHCMVSNFSNGGAKIVGLKPDTVPTNLFSAFRLTAMTTDAASLGVQRTVWVRMIPMAPRVPASR